jgi:hypothetical protein
MTKSTYNLTWLLNPHFGDETPYPHRDSITFVVVTRYAPKSTYSPKLTESIVTWSDDHLQQTIDEMLGLDGMQEWEIIEEE